MCKRITVILSACLMFLAFTFSSFGQKIKNLDKGTFSALNGQSEVNVLFSYDNMSVGDFEDANDYIAEKVSEKNADEPGSGDKWLEKWETNKKDKYEPRFFELFNEYAKNEGLFASKNPEAPYTFIIHTTHTEPGWNVGVMRRPAHINVTIKLVETGNMDNTLGETSLEKVPGRDAWGFDYDMAYRIQESYAVTGKVLGKYLIKKVL